MAAQALIVRGITRGQLAQVLGVSRERVHQLVGRDAQCRQEVLWPATTVSLRALRETDAAWQGASVRLSRALAIRRQRVQKANSHFGMGLGQIADIIGVSRSMAQQLRDSAARESRAAV
jgi:DNA-binding XRE family transcriptional regulator